jgi:Tol biopolymer transport system component
VQDSWENYSVWSPDGKHVAYASDSDGPPDIYLLEIGGGGKIPVWAAAGPQHTLPWSPDGQQQVQLLKKRAAKLGLHILEPDAA